MSIKRIPIAIGIFISIMIGVNPAWAVQGHGGAEGLISHQIAHALFIIGMGYLLLRLYRIGISASGWFEFKGFLWLIIAWNFLTFSGHWMHEFAVPEKFIKSNGSTIAFSITNFADAFLYLTKLDHLLLFPSFVFLLLALRKWRSQ